MASRDRRFTRFYSTHVAFVWRCALAFGVSNTDVDDVVQEIFLAAHRRLPTYEGRGTERAWLCGIARRVSFRIRRTDQRHRRRVDAYAEVVATPADAEERVAYREATVRVLGFLETLPSDKRQAFVLSDVEGLTRTELADALGVNPNTAWARVRSARAELARTFGDAEPGALRKVLDGVAVDLTPDARRSRAVMVAILAKIPTALATTVAIWLAPVAIGAAVWSGLAIADDAPPPPDPTMHATQVDAAPPPVIADNAASLPAVVATAIPPPPEPVLARPRASAPDRTQAPAPQDAASLAARETALVKAAHAALRADDPEQVLDVLAVLAHEFPASIYAPEASALRIAALCARDPKDARAAWRTHTTMWPQAPIPALVRTRCGADWIATVEKPAGP